MNAVVQEGWIDVCAVDDIPLLGARTLKRGAGLADVAIFRGADGMVFALEDRCPHKGGPLSQGIVHGNRVTCPLHNWTIDMANGEAVAPDHGCTKHFAVQMQNGRVLLSVAALDTAHAAPKPPACPISVTRSPC